jgi:heme/copper-type cytochrome/quinol oxidase subunit 2
VITVEKCDRVTLKVFNEDNFDHGVAIDALGISQRLPANGPIVVNFIASKSGEFQFYCSVSCSDSKSTGNLKDGVVQAGPYTGIFRGHFEHIGKFIVNAISGLIN